MTASHALRTTWRIIKHRTNVLRGKDVHLSLSVSLPTEYHGTEYGGFAILKDSLCKDSEVLSCGVGEDVSFDLSLIRKYGCRVTAVDPTPKAAEYVRKHVDTDRFGLLEVAVASQDGTSQFHLPSNPSWVSGSLEKGEHANGNSIVVSCLRLSSIIRQIGMSRFDLLKVDIEGAEYSVLEDYLKDQSATRPQQIALEFHHHFSNYGLHHTSGLCRQLESSGYFLAWVSQSNREALFIHRNRLAPLANDA